MDDEAAGAPEAPMAGNGYARLKQSDDLAGERSPSSPTAPNQGEAGHLNMDDMHKHGVAGVKSMLKTLTKLAFPVSIGYLLQMALNIEALIFAGRLGAEGLASVALGNMFVNVTGLSIGIGLSEALDTLCSQAFGAGNRPLVGLYLQRGLFVLLLISAPIIGLWFSATSILIALGQPANIATLTGTFVKYQVPALIPLFTFEVIKKFLQAQELMIPIMVMSFIANLINILATYLLFYVANLGIIGISLGIVITYWTLPFMTLGYIIYKRLHIGIWTGLKREAMTDLWPYLQLGIPSMLMLCFEWWSFEILAFMAGLMGETILAAHSVLINTASLMYMLPAGVSIAASNHIGNLLGAGYPRVARLTAWVSLAVGALTYCVVAVVLYVMRREWGLMYTSDEAVIELTNQTMHLMIIFCLNDNIGCILGGVLRGVGRQSVGAVVNFLGYYGVGLPMAYVFGLRSGGGLLGMWEGFYIGVVCVTVGYTFLTVRINWAEMSRRAQARSGVAVAHINDRTDGEESPGGEKGNEMEALVDGDTPRERDPDAVAEESLLGRAEELDAPAAAVAPPLLRITAALSAESEPAVQIDD